MTRVRPSVLAPAAALALVAALAGCQTVAPALTSAQRRAWEALDTLRTVPERTAYVHTSRYADVLAHLDRVFAATPTRAGAPRLLRTTLGTSFEGRALPLVVWGRVAAPTPEAVRASGKLVVYVQGNIHAGEVEGKEALLTFVRDLARGRHDALANRLVLLIAPIYNADGNERVDPRNRPFQLGPIGGMGVRPNAQGLDLNRDMMKLASPEARALVSLLNAYDADALLDLHTTNGSRHGYALTYAPGLHPATPAGLTSYLRETLLPHVTRTLRAEDRVEAFYYGNLGEGPRGAPDTAWASFDPRARFVTNYAGLSGRLGILSEAYSYAPFDERIRATHRFVVHTLGRLAADAALVRTLRRGSATPASVPTRTRFAAPTVETVLLGDVRVVPHPSTGEPMHARTDAVRAVRMPVYGTFEAAESAEASRRYLVPDTARRALDVLRLHGFATRAAAGYYGGERFTLDSTRQTTRPFQGVRERTVWGRYEPRSTVAPNGYVEVSAPSAAQVALLTLLLEPRSEDGLTAWGFFESALAAPGIRTHPVVRVR